MQEEPHGQSTSAMTSPVLASPPFEFDAEQQPLDQQPLSTRSELMAWILYDWATTVYPAVASSVFLPLVLEQLAFSVGRVPGSANQPCTAVNAPATNSTTPIANDQVDASQPCEVNFGPIGFVPTVSFVLYVSSISIVIQTITYISLGALADFGRWRKGLMMGFSITGSLLCISFAGVVRPELYWLAVLLTILCTVCYGCTLIFYNAYLSVLVQNHPAVRECIEDENVNLDDVEADLTLLGLSKHFGQLRERLKNATTGARERLKLAGRVFGSTSATATAAESNQITEASTQFSTADPTPQRGMTPEPQVPVEQEVHPTILGYASHAAPRRHDTVSTLSAFTRNQLQRETKLRDRLANTLSTHGIASGQLATLLMIFISLGVTLSQPQTGYGQTYALLIIITIIGVWWLVFSSVTFAYMKTRPGPPLPKKAGNPILFSWRKTFYSLSRYKRLPNTFRYLLAYFTFSNAMASIGTMAILFARKELNMSNRQISVALVIGPIAALCGGYFWLWVSRRFSWTTQKVLLVLLCLACALPAYGLLGYIPGTPEYQVIAGEGPNNVGAIKIGFGMKSVMEMYIAVFYFASLVGSMSSFGRVLYTDLLPKGHEAEFFALSEICLRGTSWIGPLIVGAIANASNGNLRPGFAYILVMLSLPIIILWKHVDIPRGRRECEIFLAEEAAKRARREEKRRQKQLRKLLKKHKEQQQNLEDQASSSGATANHDVMEMKTITDM